MFKFVKETFILAMIFSSNKRSVNSLSCILMKNQECKARPQIVNVNSNNPTYYYFSVKISKCSGNCNNINDPYSKICAPIL